jgi:prepilin-type cleavage/methylation N-terminal domain protein
MKKEKMNDKGFSLVELIIVIAIMAVLVVVLAPQYLKYVEKSRNSTDLSNATAIVTALQVYAADPDVETADAFKVGDTFDVSIVAAGSTPDSSVTSASVAAAKALGEAKITITEVHCKSKSNWTAYNIHGEVVTGGSIEFTYSSTHSGATDEFAAAMTK